jgi:hypothetical protein
LPAMWAKCVGAVNPLALFYALRGFRTPSAPVHHAVVAAIRTWLTDPAAHSTSHQYLRRAAQIALAGTDSPLVIEFANQFRDLSRMLMEARFRNGDVRAGIELCSRSDPGITDPWRDRLIAHTFSKFGRKLIDPLDSVLRDSTRPEAINLPALHLAGHIGSSQLLDAITACFSTAKFSAVTIAGFLWAFAQCSGNEPETLLGAVCDVWASLPDEGEGVGRLSQRGEVAHEIISAFSRLLPEPALRFFIARAAGDDVLRDDIVYLLSRVDHPEAVEFVARQLSDIDRRLAGTDKFLPFSHMATDHWRAERRGVQMSANSRERLKNLWLDLGNDRYLRRRAFALWAAGAMDCDLLDLRSVGTSEPIFDEALATRMVVGDRSAIPIFLSKLKGSPHREYWWQFSRNHWSDELSVALDEELKGRRQQVELAWDQKEFVTDWISSELIIRMAGAYSAESAAEAILAEHWDHVQFSSYFVQAALYIATPGASELAARALRTSPTPEQLFRFINQRFGVKTFGHPSVTDIRRLDSLVPYLDFIDPRVIYWFWELCNERHWLDWRRQHLDARITDRARASTGLDDSQLVADLNTMMSTMQNGRLGNIEFQLYHWLQRFAERGDPPDRAMRIVETWLNDRRTLDALRLVATAVIYGGGRPDLARLNVDGIAPSELAEATRFNARFAVFRRTLV